MTEKAVCSSCRTTSTNSRGTVVFKCPNCGKTDIVRCGHCREIVAKYICPECKFQGPN